MGQIAELSQEGRYLLETITNEISKINTKVDALAKTSAQHGRSIITFEEDYPLLPTEADDLSNAVKKKGVEVMGGKKSNAYKDTELRTKIFRDIYYEIKRQYGLINEKGAQLSYKKLKRKYLKGAFDVINEYVLPIDLENEVEAENELDED